MPIIAKPRKRRLPAKGTTNSTPAKSAQDKAKRYSEKKRSAKSTTPKSMTRQKSNASSKATPSTPQTGKSTTPVRRSLRSDLDNETIDSAPRAVGPQSAHTPAAGTNRSGKQRGATTRTPPSDSKSPGIRKRPARNIADANGDSSDEVDAPAAHAILTTETTRSTMISATSRKPPTRATRRKRKTTTCPNIAKSTHARTRLPLGATDAHSTSAANTRTTATAPTSP